MKPPIPSPFPEPVITRPITKHVQWDEDEQCFYLMYASRIKERLRCELFTCWMNPLLYLGMTLYLPLTLLILWFSQSRARKQPGRVSIYQWGIRDIAPEASIEMPWPNLKKVINRGGNIFVRRHNFFHVCVYFPLENFADAEESKRFEEIVSSLLASQGSNWEIVKQQFQKS